jgi:type VI protein secretion system component VasK
VVLSLTARWSAGPFGGILNLCVGVVCVAAGLSGKLLFVGTGSSWPFTAVGAFFAVVGGLRLWRWWVRRRAEAKEAAKAHKEADTTDG